MKTHPLPLLFYFFMVIILASCWSVKEPEFRAIENIRVGKLGFGNSTLHLDLHYFNPNNSRIKLKKAEGDAWIENNFLGHFTIDTLVLIPARGEFSLPIKLEVDMKKIVTNSLVAFLSKEVTVKVEGKARVGKGFIFINYPLSYEGKHNMGELMK